MAEAEGEGDSSAHQTEREGGVGGGGGEGGPAPSDPLSSALRREVCDLRFVNISIKSYDKKTGAGFPREEYFAFRIVSMYVSVQ